MVGVGVGVGCGGAEHSYITVLRSRRVSVVSVAPPVAAERDAPLTAEQSDVLTPRHTAGSHDLGVTGVTRVIRSMPPSR